jgi:pimeloyl-ACP methyl ester carboxylesterase
MPFFRYAVLTGVLFLTTLCCAVQAHECAGVKLVRLKTTDNVELAGVLRQPDPDKYKAAIVMVHGYSGNFYASIMAFLPEKLTDNGFITLAVNMRDHDRVPKKNLFEENRYDIGAAVDEIDRRGYKSIFLYGHSMGTNRVLDYVVSTQDPRIAGIILTGPPGNLFEWNERMFGPDKAAQVLRQAQKLKAEGHGNEWMLVDLGPLGKALYTANHLVSLRGPETVSDPYKNIARVTPPVLIVHGLADHLAQPEVADRLGRQARPGTHVKVVKIAGADHQFRCCRQELTDTISAWLLKQLDP